MRVKVVTPPPDSFRATALYLAGQTKRLSPDRVEWVFGHNLPTTEPRAAALAMEAIAERSVRCEKPVYHFSLNFDPKDANAGKVKPPMMQEIARRVLTHLGLDEHQALVYGHRDANHPHMHFLVNRVHPLTGLAWSKSHDFERLMSFTQEVAREYGLNVPERKKEREKERLPTEGEYWQARREKREAHRQFGNEARDALREKLWKEFYQATSWHDLTKRLNRHGYSLEPKGQGLVVTDGVRAAKLSSLGKKIRLPELEKRFGQRFADYAITRTGELVFALEQAGAPVGPPQYDAKMTATEKRAIEREYLAALESAARTAIKHQASEDPVLQLDAADLDYLAWSSTEATYREAQKRTLRGEKNEGYLTDRERTLRARADNSRTDMMELLGRFYADHEEAAKRWDRLERDEIDDTDKMLRRNLGTIGKRRLDDGLDTILKEKRAAGRLIGARNRWRRATAAAEVARGDLQHARRLTKEAFRDWEMLNLKMDYGYVRRIVAAKIEQRIRALERVKVQLIERSTLADERKEQLHEAWRLFHERKRERSRLRELGLER